MRIRQAVIFLLLATPLLAMKSAGRIEDTFDNDELTVVLAPNASIQTINTIYGTFLKEQIPGSTSYLLGLLPGTDLEDTLDRMLLDPRIVFADRNFEFQTPEVRQLSQAFLEQLSQAFLEGQAPVNFYGQTAMVNLHMTEAQQFTRGAGVRVAVIDTGVDFSHPLLAGRIVGPYFDFLGNDGVPNDEPGGTGYGHGTFVAGLIALGAPDARIMPLRVFGPDGRASSFTIARAIRYATDNGADVINMSFGLIEETGLVKDALEYAYHRVYMVAAAGNESRDLLQFPADVPSKTLSVGATDGNDRKAAFSNFNRRLAAAAPGVQLYSAYPGGRWAWWTGTSFSTALVTAEAAQLLAIDRGQSRSNLNRIIVDSGVNIDGLNPAYSGKIGRRIDYLAAVRLLLSRQ